MNHVIKSSMLKNFQKRKEFILQQLEQRENITERVLACNSHELEVLLGEMHAFLRQYTFRSINQERNYYTNQSLEVLCYYWYTSELGQLICNAPYSTLAQQSYFEQQWHHYTNFKKNITSGMESIVRKVKPSITSKLNSTYKSMLKQLPGPSLTQVIPFYSAPILRL